MTVIARLLRRTSHLTRLAVLTVPLSGCGGGEIRSPGMPPELKHSWEVSFNKGDAAAIARLYSGQAELVMTGSPPVKGPDAIRATVEQMIRSGAKVEIGSAQNIGSGDIAYVYGPYAVRDHEGGKVIEQGSFLEVWRKRGGTWQIDLDVNSTGAAPGQTNTP